MRVRAAGPRRAILEMNVDPGVIMVPRQKPPGACGQAGEYEGDAEETSHWLGFEAPRRTTKFGMGR